MNPYRDKAREVLANAEKYHRAFYQTEVFQGPSLYFHRRALETRQPPIAAIHLEYVYATLASWGMHRMGTGGSKMLAFDIFRQSLEPLKESIAKAQELTPQNMNPRGWEVLKDIFTDIKVMHSKTSLVGNSKVMHHMMPNIVPPIDREYTLRYLRGNTNIRNDEEREWQMMKEIMSDFFFPIALDAQFDSRAKGWMARPDQYRWDTSVMKIVDNLVIGSRK